MLIQGQLTVRVRVWACRDRVESGAQALTLTDSEHEATTAFPGYTQSSISQDRGSRKVKNGEEGDRDSGACRGNHTMSFLGVPRDEGRIWFSMVTTCWSRGHTEFLDPFIPKKGRGGVGPTLSQSDSDELSVSQSIYYERPHETLEDSLSPALWGSIYSSNR